MIFYFFLLHLFRILLPLRNVDSQGRTVIIVRPCFYDPSKLQMADLLKVSFHSKIQESEEKYKNFLN